jgi:hypothetical protein
VSVCCHPPIPRPAPFTLLPTSARPHPHPHPFLFLFSLSPPPAGYLFNIGMLRRVFQPTFTLHDIRRTGPLELTTRWTMTMCLSFAKGGPLQRLWDPQLTFTGTSIMGINPQTGALGVHAVHAVHAVHLLRLGSAVASVPAQARATPRLPGACCCPPTQLPLPLPPPPVPSTRAGKFNRHVDTWDAVQQQRYFSFEAFSHMLSQASAGGAGAGWSVGSWLLVWQLASAGLVATGLQGCHGSCRCRQVAPVSVARSSLASPRTPPPPLPRPCPASPRPAGAGPAEGAGH